jgi:hypothetical protein
MKHLRLRNFQPSRPHVEIVEINTWSVIVLGLQCGLVVRVPAYRSRGPGFDSCRHQIFLEVLGVERRLRSFVRINEKLLEGKSSGFGLENRRITAVGICRAADHATPSTHKSRNYFAGRSDRSVSIVALHTKITEIVGLIVVLSHSLNSAPSGDISCNLVPEDDEPFVTYLPFG